MTERYDAIVVGARCGGAPAAMLLARYGYRILLVDRVAIGTDTFSGNFIHPPGVAALARWGVLQKLMSTNAPPIRQTRFDVGPFALVGTPPAVHGINVSYAPRRTVLDVLLVEGAVAAGADFRDRFKVQELIFDGDRACGVRSVTPSGRTIEERAKLVIGADGKNSRVARAVAAPIYRAHAAFTCNYARYFTNLTVNEAELYVREGHFIVAVPTHQALALINVVAPAKRFREFRADIPRMFDTLLSSAPGLYQRVHSAQPASRFLGTVDLASFYRRPYGNGWALVGDAGYHKDPITAQGITDAFLDAELLAKAAHQALAGETPFAQAMRAYEDARNQRVEAMYQLTCDLAQLSAPNADMNALFNALKDSPDDCNAFVGTVAGTVPIHRFFSPENITRILGEHRYRTQNLSGRRLHG